MSVDFLPVAGTNQKTTDIWQGLEPSNFSAIILFAQQFGPPAVLCVVVLTILIFVYQNLR